jgi:hypothetical protein
MPLTKHLARELGVVIYTTSTSGNPSPEQRHMTRIISAASAAVAVARVGTACTLPDSRSTWFCIMSNPPAVVGSSAIQSTPFIPTRRAGRGRGWTPCSAFILWYVWHVRTYSIASRSCPTQKTRRRASDPVLARPKCPPSGPSCHSRSTCVLSPPPLGMHSLSAEPCPRRYSRPHRTRNTPQAASATHRESRRRVGRQAGRASPQPADDWTEQRVRDQLPHQVPNERRREEVGVRQDRRSLRSPRSQLQLQPCERHKHPNPRTRGGYRTAPGPREGDVVPHLNVSRRDCRHQPVHLPPCGEHCRTSRRGPISAT